MSQVLQDRAQKVFTLIQNQPQGLIHSEASSRFENSSLKIIESCTEELPLETKNRFIEEFTLLGPLESLLKDRNISEIIINSWDSIWIEQEGVLKENQDSFLCPETYQQIFYKVCELFKVNLTTQVPQVCASWKNFRLTACIPPLSPHPTLNIRRHQKKEISLEQLKNNSMLNESQLSLLRESIRRKKTLLIIGQTGSGKTTLLNACLSELEKNERVVLLEDTPELHICNSTSTRLLTRNAFQDCYSAIDLNDLIKMSLRMRPDRLVVGEVRGHEAKDLLLAISSGHKGSFCTLHADHAKQALIRLEMLIQLGAPQWSLEAIRQLIYLSIDTIVVVKRDKEGFRQVKSIQKLAGVEKFGILLEEANLNDQP